MGSALLSGEAPAARRCASVMSCLCAQTVLLITLPSSIFFRLAIDANVDAIIPEIGSNSQAFNRANFEVNS
jgi:hypothetical protein